MKQTNILESVMIAMLVVVLVVLSAVIVQNISSSATAPCLNESLSYNDTLLTESTSTLTPVGQGITSSEVKAYNQTWLDFDGVNDYVNTENTQNLSNGLTVSIWVKSNSATCVDFGEIFLKQYSPRITTRTSCQIYFTAQNSTGQDKPFNSGSNYLSDMLWHNIVYRYNAENNYSYGYIDGNFVGGTSLEGLGLNNYNYTLGGKISGTTFFNGSIDNVKLYNYSLNETEIKNLYYTGISKIDFSLNKSNIGINSSRIYRLNDTHLYTTSGITLYKSTDGGLTWNGISNFTESPWSGHALFIDTRGTIFVTMRDNGNISLSMGNESNWTSVQVMSCLNQSGNAGYGVGTEWGFTESKDGSLLLGEYGGNNQSAMNCSYIHKSTDGGLTWDIVYNGTEQYPEAPARHIHLVRTDPYTGYIYATQGDTPPESRLLRSIDNGTTWESLENVSDTSQYLSLVFTENCRIFGTDKNTGNGIVKTCDDENFSFIYKLPSENGNGQFWDMEKYENYIIATTTAFNSTSSGSNFATIVISPDNGNNWFTLPYRYNSLNYQGIQWISKFTSDGYSILYDNNLSTSYIFNIINQSIDLPINILTYNLNENNGTTAHDTSGNGNDGTISGATWQNDGVLNTLTNLVDYTIDTSSGLFTIVNDDYSWSYLEAIITYANDKGDCLETLDNIQEYYGLFLVNLVGFLGLIGTIVGVVWLVLYVRRLFDKREGLQELTA